MRRSAHHGIVAHSHGGNVALYALRDVALRRKIDGVVTLGTPFIHCRPRPLEGPLKLLESSVFPVFFILVVIPTFLFLTLCGLALMETGYKGWGIASLVTAVPVLGFIFLRPREARVHSRGDLDVHCWSMKPNRPAVF